MVAKLTKEHVKSICESRDLELIYYESSRKKIRVNCINCDQNPQEYWWSQIRDGQSCRYCSGAKIDLLEAFRRHGLRPLTEPKNYNSTVDVECIRCVERLPEKASYKNLLRAEDTPCWICNSYQLQKRESFLKKGWELGTKFTKRDRYYSCQCVVCGHFDDVHGNTIEKHSANCNICRDSRLYRLIGARLEALNGELSGPINLSKLKSRSPALCKQCNEQRTLVFKDVVYGQQGFCMPCGVEARAAKRRKNDFRFHLDRLQLTFVSGSYENEDSVITFKCKECDKPDKTTVSQLRIRTSGCQYCLKRKLIEDPLDLFREKGFSPLSDKFFGHTTPTPCICPRCNQITSPTRLNLQQGHFGCTCILEDHPGVYNKKYFQNHPDHKGLAGGLYLIQFKDNDNTVFLKIGIHLLRTSRVNTHTSRGGTCIQYIAGALYDCWVAEQEIIAQLKEYKYVPIMEINGGRTECLKDACMNLEKSWAMFFGTTPDYFMEAKNKSNEILLNIYPLLKTSTELPRVNP